MKLGIVGAVLVVMSGVAGCGTGQVTVHFQTAKAIPVAMASVCEPEWKTLATAAEAYAAYTGAYPTDQFVLVAEGLVLRTIDDFEYSTVGDGYVLTGVGQCFGFDPNIPSGDADPEPASDVSGCDADLKTLQTAWEAFNAQYGTAPDSQGDLVDAGFLREPSSHFDLIGSEFVPVPGACE